MVDRATVTINNTPLNPAARYKIITIDSVAEGGNNFSVMADPRHRLSFLDMATTDMEALQAYLGKTSAANPLQETPARITCKLKTGADCGIPVLQ